MRLRRLRFALVSFALAACGLNVTGVATDAPPTTDSGTDAQAIDTSTPDVGTFAARRRR